MVWSRGDASCRIESGIDQMGTTSDCRIRPMRAPVTALKSTVGTIAMAAHTTDCIQPIAFKKSDNVFSSRSEMPSKTAVPLEAKLTENAQFPAKDRRLLISGSQLRVLLRPPLEPGSYGILFNGLI
jgi:hypothetical protein